MSSNTSNNGFPRGRGIFPLDPNLSPRGRGIIYLGQNSSPNGRGAFSHNQTQSPSNRVVSPDEAHSPRGRGMMHTQGRGFNTPPPVHHSASFNDNFPPLGHQPFGWGVNQTNSRGFHSSRGHVTNTRGVPATVQSHYTHTRSFQGTSFDHETNTRGFHSNHGYHTNSRGIGPSVPAGIQPIFGRGRGIPGNNDNQQQDNQRRNFGNYGRGNASKEYQDYKENSPRRGKSKMNWSGSEAGRGIKTMAGGMESKARGRGTGSPTRGGRYRNDRGGQPPGYNPNHKFYKVEFSPASIPEWIPSNLPQLQISSTEKLFCDKIKNKTQQSINIRQELERVINDCVNPRLSVLRIIMESRNMRGVVVDFEKWLKSRTNQYPSLTQAEKDLAVKAFLSEDKPTNLTSAINVFEIKSEEYKGVVPHLVEKQKYKQACDWATCLKLFDMFQLSDFVIPLLVQGKLNTFEGYLDHSPRLGEQFVLFLDAVITDDSLIDPYISISTRDGISQLKGKTMDKIIKRYASKFDIDTIGLPNFSARLDTNDLIYWTREYNNIEPEAITAWRELMLSKLERVPHLKSMFLDRLVRVDMEETKFWSKKLGIRTENIEFLFSSEMTLTEEREEEYWLDGGGISNKTKSDTKKEIVKTSTSDTWNNCDINEDGSNNSKYFTLPITGDNLKFIDSVEDALDCFHYLSQASMIGLDGEFTTGPHRSNLSILQLSTLDKSFVLDVTSLATKMTTEEWSKLTHLIIHPDIMILGYGIQDDLVLLSKTSSALQPIIQKKKNVVCLDKLKDQLFSLLQFQKSMVKGLSGTAESVLGKRLNKAEQISNWDRRPLRRAQLEYAALDAYIVLALYNKIEAVAEEKGKVENFRQIINDFVSGKTKPKQNAQEKKDSESKAPVLGPLNKEPIKPKELHVVCDTMLQGVCKKLRVCGVDALALNNSQTHEHCLALRKEMLERVSSPVYILSRGKPAQLISKQLPRGHCFSVVSDLLDEQIKEIFQYFNVVADENDLFSRCVICNGDQYIKLARHHLERLWKMEEKTRCIPAGAESMRRRSPTKKQDGVEGFMDSGQSSGEEDFDVMLRRKPRERLWLEAEGGKVDLNSGEMENNVKIGVKNVPPNTLKSVEEFWICFSCGKVYWQGSHWEKAQDRVKDFLNVAPSPVPKPKS